MAIWRMRIACWILKATDTHSDYIILIAFPLQQWLRECASMISYTYIACLVFLSALFMYISTNGIFIHPVPQSIPFVQFTDVPPLNPIKQTHIKSYKIITFLRSHLFHKF
jgi:hypothetical protein